MSPLVSEVARALSDSGIDLGALGLAWARAMPCVVIVPAFGLRAIPQPARVVLALALAATIFPALAPIASAEAKVPWALMLVSEVLQGLPVAIAAAVPLWAATMAGGLVDSLRGAQAELQVAVVEGKASPLGVPFSILASGIFLATGGPSRIAGTLASGALPAHPVLAAAQDLAGGIAIAVSIGGPLLAAALVLEVTAALVARASSPAQIHALLAPLRALGLLAVMAVVLDRVVAAMAVVVRSRP